MASQAHRSNALWDCFASFSPRDIAYILYFSGMHSSANCANCEYQLQEASKFCSNCGQKADTHRLTMHHVWHDLFHAFTHTDRSIFHLISKLLKKPGHVSREYVEGKRKKYFNPFSFLVIVTAITAFLAATFETMSVGLSPNPISRFVNNNANLAIFLTVPLSAFFSWIFFRRTGVTYAENLVLSAYTSAERSVIYSIILVPIIVLFKPYFLFIIYFYHLAWVTYFGMACKQFFNRNRGSDFWLGALAAFCAQLVIFMIIFGAFYIYFKFFGQLQA